MKIEFEGCGDVHRKRILELEETCKDGSTIWLESTFSPLRDGQNRLTGFLGISRDITDRKKLEEKLQVMSNMDELTGLYNRRGFFALASQQFKIVNRTEKSCLLFFIDLDKLKWINDTLGHQEGDMAIVETACLLRGTFRTSDIIGRMGGDEFAVLAIDTDEESPDLLTKRLQKFLDKANEAPGRKYNLSLSVGIASYHAANPASLDDLIAQADGLMYEEKKKKRRQD